jgi:hypothetical protein
MPTLENIKDVWKKQVDCKYKFSKEELFEMMHLKSSSAVKWILIISILEFIIPNVLLLFSDYKGTIEFYHKYELTGIMEVYFAIHFVIILYFIYRFYKNYKNISAEQSVKELMENIIQTRKTVKYYIYYNIAIAGVIGVHIFYRVFHSEVFLEQLPEDANMTTIWIMALVIFGFVLFLFWVVYRIIYGFLLRRLKLNYRELKKTE